LLIILECSRPFRRSFSGVDLPRCASKKLRLHHPAAAPERPIDPNFPPQVLSFSLLADQGNFTPQSATGAPEGVDTSAPWLRHVVTLGREFHINFLNETYGQMTSVAKPCGRISRCDADPCDSRYGARACGVWSSLVTFHRCWPKLRTGANLIAMTRGMSVVDQARASSSRTWNCALVCLGPLIGLPAGDRIGR